MKMNNIFGRPRELVDPDLKSVVQGSLEDLFDKQS